MPRRFSVFFFFFFNDTATTEIYTLSLHDALPIFEKSLFLGRLQLDVAGDEVSEPTRVGHGIQDLDRKSTRLNSSHPSISYAVFCLKKKTKTHDRERQPPTQHTISTHACCA